MAERTYENDRIRVHWSSALCIHTGRCVRAQPGVFDVKRRPWVDVDAADADAVAAAVERCPTGALTYERLDGAPGEQPPATTTITALPNGPLAVRGAVEVRDGQGGALAAGSRLTLCRCGHSRNQPFCDLSHRAAGFRNTPVAESTRRRQAECPEDIDPVPGP